MRLFKFFILCIICIVLNSCSSSRIKYRFSHQPERFCDPLKHRYREATPFKFFNQSSINPLAYYLSRDKNYLIRQLSLANMEFIQYRDIINVIIPVDQYFEIDSAKLDERQLSKLEHLVDLIYLSPCTTVHVAAFADSVGTRTYNNQLTQAQAEAMLTYLWANGIPADHLNAQGFGKRFAIAENDTARGSAMNRRVEVQWTVRQDKSLHDVADLSMK